MEFIKKYFRIEERGTTIRTEVLGGLTTFLTMAYILFANPGLMSGFGAVDGLDANAVFLATALAAGLATLAMGLFAKLPVALAPGMGLNAFFSFTIVLGMGYSWEEALAAVLVSGVLYLVITLLGVRQKVVAAIPQSLKYAIGAGIGFFIAYIGLVNVGIVINTGGTTTSLGDLTTPVALLALFGIILTMVLLALKVRAAVFFGLVITAVVGLIAGFIFPDAQGLPVYTAFIGSVPSLAPTFGKAFSGIVGLLSQPAGWFAVFAFLFVDFFDTSGTLMAVTGQMENVTEEDIQNANIVDSSATVVGAVLGTSTVTSYIESLSGVGAGARTGLASVVTGVLFLLSIFLSPLLTLVTSSVTAAAMVIVGTMMAASIGKIEWDKWQISIASFMTILVMILSYSISDGIGFGFLTYVVVMIASKKGKEVSPLLYGATALFIAYIVFLNVL
ncbi:MAG: NCS2 family permease [Acholeplasma sp.]|jgi:AGZA family xanthine/uracil permease-like MFS transporter|nr:MAG: NCS2 family permease [Acholeplasma sp.]